MRAIVVSGVLGVGTLLVFAAAAATALLFPNGSLVGGSWNGGWRGDVFVGANGGGVMAPPPAIAVPMPVEVPAGKEVDPQILVEASFAPLPGDQTGGFVVAPEP